MAEPTSVVHARVWVTQDLRSRGVVVVSGASQRSDCPRAISYVDPATGRRRTVVKPHWYVTEEAARRRVQKVVGVARAALLRKLLEVARIELEWGERRPYSSPSDGGPSSPE